MLHNTNRQSVQSPVTLSHTATNQWRTQIPSCFMTKLTLKRNFITHDSIKPFNKPFNTIWGYLFMLRVSYPGAESPSCVVNLSGNPILQWLTLSSMSVAILFTLAPVLLHRFTYSSHTIQFTLQTKLYHSQSTKNKYMNEQTDERMRKTCKWLKA